MHCEYAIETMNVRMNNAVTCEYYLHEGALIRLTV